MWFIGLLANLRLGFFAISLPDVRVRLDSLRMVKHHILILSLLFVLIHCLLGWHYGIRVLFDSPAYIEAADHIVSKADLQDIHHLYYAVPILIMAGFRLLFPGDIVPILLFQCALSLLATKALYKSSEKVFDSPIAGLMSGAIFVLWIDNIHWNITTMTESISCSVFCFALYTVTNWQSRLKDILTMTLLLILVFFSRPTGVVIVISAFVFLMTYYWRSLAVSRALLISVAIIGSLAIVFGADKMLDHWNFTEQYMRGNIITYADVVKGRPLFHESLSIQPPSSTEFSTSGSPIGRVVWFIYDNPVYFFKTAALKVWYLMAFIRPYYSWPHNLYLVLWTSLIYVFLVLGWRSTSDLPIKLFVLTAIILNCGLIAISSVDWDNRFYIPMEPGIVLLAGGGAAYLLERIQRRLSVNENTNSKKN